MKTKIKLIAFLSVLLLLISNVSSTYARYVSASTGNVVTDFARWQILINNDSITENYNTNLQFTPTIEANDNVAAGKFAAGSTGYFDIEVNPTYVDVSFDYNIAISVAPNSDLSDVVINDYALIDPDTPNVINKVSYNGTSITGTKNYDNSNSEFVHETFIVRVYFKWDDVNGTMSDIQDTAIGNMAAKGEDINFDLVASITFSQHVE